MTLPLTAILDDCLRLPVAQTPPELLATLRERLDLPDPRQERAARFGNGRKQPGVLRRVVVAHGQVVLPRGAVAILREAAAACGVQLAFRDLRRCVPLAASLRTPTLRPYQQGAVESFLRRQQGQVLIPCGGGKTRCGLAIMGHLCQHTLVLVHTIDLAEQWVEQIRTHVLPPDMAVGLIGDGVYRPAAVTVALIQTLLQTVQRHDEVQLDALFRRFGLVILDEAHHVAAETFAGIVDRCPARYRLGLTATPERADGLTPLLETHLGRVIHQVSHAELLEHGVLAAPQVQVVPTAFTCDPDTEWHHLMARVHDCPQRMELVADRTARQVRAGRSTLVLAERVDYAEQVAGRLGERGVAAVAVTGRTRRDARARALRDMRSGQLRCMVATQLADEGLDLPNLAALVLASPCGTPARIEQRVGRVMRPHPAKGTPLVVDILDARVPALARLHRRRLETYARVGAQLDTPLFAS